MTVVNTKPLGIDRCAAAQFDDLKAYRWPGTIRANTPRATGWPRMPGRVAGAFRCAGFIVILLGLVCAVPEAQARGDRCDEDDDDRDVRGVRGDRGDRDDGDDGDRDLEVDVSIGASAIGPPMGGARIGGWRVPPIASVLEAAYEAAGLDRDPTTSWIGRARVAGLIPWLTVRTGWDQNWRDDEPDVGRSRTFEVRATWRLDRLLFDGRELQMSSIDMARRRERRRLGSRVIQIYFHWRKVAEQAARSPRFALAAEAATAELDALTDGWFSDHAVVAR